MTIHKIKVKALVNLNGVKAGEIFEILPGVLPYFIDKVEVINEKETKKEVKKTKNKAILKPKKTK